MIDDDDDLEIYVTYSFDVSIVRLIGNVFLPTTFSIATAIERGEEDTDEGLIEAALNRCKYWFDNVVSKCIAFDRDNENAFTMLIDENGVNRTNNLFLLCPGDPSDELMATMFQAKMNALGQGAINVGSIEVKSDNLIGLSFTLAGDHSITLPQEMEEWVNGPTHFNSPWWTRSDASTLDVTAPDDADLSEKPGWAYSLDFIDRPSRTKVTGAQDSTVREFKPTVIEGGKKPPKPDE